MSVPAVSCGTVSLTGPGSRETGLVITAATDLLAAVIGLSATDVTLLRQVILFSRRVQPE